MGDSHFKERDLKNTLKYIRDTQDCFTILNGDLMNNALKTSKSDSYKEVIPIEEQQEIIISLLEPIKNKILYMAQGNHEYRTSMLAGIDPLKYVARALGITERYSDNSYVLQLKFGNNKNIRSKFNYVIYGLHGCGTGGRRMGSTVNALEDMTKIIPNADLYIHSHTHVPVSYTDRIFEINRYREQIEERYRTFFNTNSFLDYGGYAERYGFKPTDLTPYVITIKYRRFGDVLRPVTNVIKLDI